jgi:hypothetical protein
MNGADNDLELDWNEDEEVKVTLGVQLLSSVRDGKTRKKYRKTASALVTLRLAPTLRAVRCNDVSCVCNVMYCMHIEKQA